MHIAFVLLADLLCLMHRNSWYELIHVMPKKFPAELVPLGQNDSIALAEMVPLCQIRPCSENGALSSNHHSADCTWQWCSVYAYVRMYVHMVTVVQNRWGWLSRPDVHNWYLVNSLQWNQSGGLWDHI